MQPTDEPAAGPSRPPPPPSSAPPEEASRGTLSALWGTASPTTKTEGKPQPRKRRKKDDAGQGRLVLGAEGMSVATPPAVLEPAKEKEKEGEEKEEGKGKGKRGRGKRKEGGDGELSHGVERRLEAWTGARGRALGAAVAATRRPPSSWQLSTALRVQLLRPGKLTSRPSQGPGPQARATTKEPIRTRRRGRRPFTHPSRPVARLRRRQYLQRSCGRGRHRHGMHPASVPGLAATAGDGARRRPSVSGGYAARRAEEDRVCERQ